ncbi:MAG: CYTH domain-containing protein [Acetivibrio sp.]
MEIEKKFQIKKLPEHLEEYPKKVIEQGYLCESPVVRIRKSNEDYILTYKSKFGLEKETEKEKAARICNEVEVPLDEKGYEHLKKKIDGHLIKKVRYLIPLEGKLIAELDIFEGYLKGLIFVEVEFSSKEEAEAFLPPEWFGKEVTFDRSYANKNLAMVDSFEEMKYNKGRLK